MIIHRKAFAKDFVPEVEIMHAHAQVQGTTDSIVLGFAAGQYGMMARWPENEFEVIGDELLDQTIKRWRDYLKTVAE